jgi:hypothetical protein
LIRPAFFGLELSEGSSAEAQYAAGEEDEKRVFLHSLFSIGQNARIIVFDEYIPDLGLYEGEAHPPDSPRNLSVSGLSERHFGHVLDTAIPPKDERRLSENPESVNSPSALESKAGK